MLLGNKSDCRGPDNAGKCVAPEVARRYAEEEKLLFEEVSAKSGDRVSASLQTLADAVCESPRPRPLSPPRLLSRSRPQ